MMLVDTSVWIDHLRAGDAALVAMLEADRVLTHPFVVGEIALGSLRQRDQVLSALRDLPRAMAATDDEVFGLIDQQGLYGKGIGYIDAHLLAAARLTPDCALWTRDRRLLAVAEQLGLAARTAH
jgi:predicted nucleic acid-binding protein